MWNIPYNLGRLTPPQKSDYEFIKTIKLYVPYKEIGIIALVRKEEELQFFYETILNMVGCNCRDTEHIAYVMGVEKNILDYVVGEMSKEELVYIKGGRLTLTLKGKEALVSLKQTLLEKEEINRIYINAITGEIAELEHTYKRPEYNSACLKEEIEVTDDFIAKRVNEFNEFYQNRQDAFSYSGQQYTVKKEIFQLLEKKYEKVCYVEETVYVYRSLTDNDLLFECKNDAENIYGNTLAKQMTDYHGARNFLVTPRACSKYTYRASLIDEKKDAARQKLVKAIEKSNKSSNATTEQIDPFYFTDRYLFEGEYSHILDSIKTTRPSEIIVSSPNLRELLQHDVINLLQACLDRAKVLIIADAQEFKISELKPKVVNHKGKKRNQIRWVERNDIRQTDIVLYPKCAITINYLPIKVGGDYLIQEIAEITYDKKKIQEEKDSLVSEINKRRSM